MGIIIIMSEWRICNKLGMRSGLNFKSFILVGCSGIRTNKCVINIGERANSLIVGNKLIKKESYDINEQACLQALFLICFFLFSLSRSLAQL